MSQGTLYDGFAQCCTVTADLTSLAALQPFRTNAINGKAYKELSFSVGVFFGSTSLRASLIWAENVCAFPSWLVVAKS